MNNIIGLNFLGALLQLNVIFQRSGTHFARKSPVYQIFWDEWITARIIHFIKTQITPSEQSLPGNLGQPATAAICRLFVSRIFRGFAILFFGFPFFFDIRSHFFTFFKHFSIIVFNFLRIKGQEGNSL